MKVGETTRSSGRLTDMVHLPREITLLRLGEKVVLSNAQKLTQRIKKNKETGKYVPNKEQDKSTERDLHELEN